MRVSLIVAAFATLSLGACKPAPPSLKHYDYPALGFSISLPAPPKVTDEPAGADGSPHMVTVEADDGIRNDAVSITDAPDPQKDIDSLTKAAADAMAKGLDAEPGMPTYAATAEGVDGREFVLSKGGRPGAKVRLFLAGGRFYVLAAKSSAGVDDPAVDDFLTSFHVIAAKPPAPNAPAANAAPTNAS
jgi:hypothetical protein